MVRLAGRYYPLTEQVERLPGCTGLTVNRSVCRTREDFLQRAIHGDGQKLKGRDQHCVRAVRGDPVDRGPLAAGRPTGAMRLDAAGVDELASGDRRGKPVIEPWYAIRTPNLCDTHRFG